MKRIKIKKNSLATISEPNQWTKWNDKDNIIFNRRFLFLRHPRMPLEISMLFLEPWGICLKIKYALYWLLEGLGNFLVLLTFVYRLQRLDIKGVTGTSLPTIPPPEKKGVDKNNVISKDGSLIYFLSASLTFLSYRLLEDLLTVRTAFTLKKPFQDLLFMDYYLLLSFSPCHVTYKHYL